MRHGALLLVLLAAGCSRAPSARETYDAAWKELRSGRFKSAQQIVEAADRQGTSAESVALRLVECEIVLGLGEPRRAWELLEQFPEPKDPAHRLRWLVLRAEALHKTRRTDQALPLLDEVDRISGSESSDTAFRARLLRAAILAGRGFSREAEEALRAVAAGAAKANDAYNQAGALVNFSYARLRSGRYDDSLAYSISAVKAAEIAGALRMAGVANDNLGIAYTMLGDLTRAEQHLEVSIRQLREAGDRFNLTDALGELGNVHLRKGAPERAQPFFEEAVGIAVANDFRDAAALWSGQLALSLIEQRKWPEAEAANRRASQLRESGDLYLKLNDAAIARGLGRSPEAREQYRSLLAANPKDSYLVWMGHIGLGSLLAEAGDFEAADAEYVEGLTVIEGIRSNLHQRDYRILYQDQKMRFFREYVEFLVSQGETERALQVVEFSRVRVLVENLEDQPESIGDVPVAALRRYAARTGSVLLSYWIAPKRSFVWAITADAITMHELPAADAIEPLVRIHRKAIEQDMRDPIGMSLPHTERLSGLLLGPVRGQLQGARRVAVVPDGPLHALNFETLEVDGGKYWIEEVEVSVAPSLTVLSQPPAKRGAKPSLLLVGDPLPADPQFPALPAAKDEISGIQSQFVAQQQVVRTGQAATPAGFLEAMPENFSMIHFTAHAEANPQSPFESAVILSRDLDQDRYKLYARDIAELSLRAELVTISACRSAGAQSYGGEGLVGFAWAFLHAGARSVIAGLWDVGDHSSAMLMTRLYEGLADGMPPAAALREAKLSLLRSGGAYRNPFYWAPYQTYTR